jgi:NitT/TauT family transport system substrate-binding protein
MSDRTDHAIPMRRIGALLLLFFLAICSPARAETSRVRVATGFGLTFLPLVLMEHDHLWEKHAKILGADIQVEYARLGGGAGLNDALLSGSVELVVGGLAPMLLMWDRTINSARVRGLAALNTAPIDVLANRPGLRSLSDFTPADRIALPAIKSSIQAIVLMAAAEKTFGPGQANRLDGLTVTMQHPDALTALLTHGSQITGFVAISPFQEIALAKPGVVKLTDSTTVFGGPTTVGVVYAKDRFAADNPVLLRAFYAALAEAMVEITTQRDVAIGKYLAVTQEKTDPALIAAILASPDIHYGMEPVGTLTVAHLMHRYGLLHHNPESWKEYFAAPLHDRSGS